MDFDRLPDHVCMKILKYLPLRKQVRIARVSQRFQELSEMVVSLKKRLDFDDHGVSLRIIKPTALPNVLDLCASGLKVANFCSIWSGPGWGRSILNEYLDEFANFRYPRLETLQINGVRLNAQMMRDLLTNCPRMRRLALTGCETEGDLSTCTTVTCTKMESVSLSCPLDAFETIIDCCPNLKEITASTGDIPSQWEAALNSAFSKRPGLEEVKLYGSYGPNITIDVLQIGNLFHLRSLRSLMLWMNSAISNLLMTAISTTFKQLEQIELTGNFESWHGIATLRNLKKLRWLVLHQTPKTDDPLTLDQGVRHLASSERLEQVRLVQWRLAQETVVAFTRECPRLQQLITDDVHGIESKAQAKMFMQSLQGFVQQSLTIQLLNYGYVFSRGLWVSKSVRAELAEVNESGQGRVIRFKIGSYLLPPLPRENNEHRASGNHRSSGGLLRKVIDVITGLYHVIFG